MVQFLNENQEILHFKEIKLVAKGITGAKTETAGFQGEKLLSGAMQRCPYFISCSQGKVRYGNYLSRSHSINIHTNPMYLF